VLYCRDLPVLDSPSDALGCVWALSVHGVHKPIGPRQTGASFAYQWCCPGGEWFPSVLRCYTAGVRARLPSVSFAEEAGWSVQNQAVMLG